MKVVDFKPNQKSSESDKAREELHLAVVEGIDACVSDKDNGSYINGMTVLINDNGQLIFSLCTDIALIELLGALDVAKAKLLPMITEGEHYDS